MFIEVFKYLFKKDIVIKHKFLKEVRYDKGLKLFDNVFVHSYEELLRKSWQKIIKQVLLIGLKKIILMIC